MFKKTRINAKLAAYKLAKRVNNKNISLLLQEWSSKIKVKDG